MSPLVLPVCASSPPSPVATARARLSRRPFPPDATIGIPYYDVEFDMAQSTAHAATVRDLGQFLDRLAEATGLQVLSDNPVWYWIHADEQQRILYPDYALADTATPQRALATDLRLALEIVSTERAEKERKDSERMRERNAANGVPEFALLYPEPDDARVLRWFRLDPDAGVYLEAALPADRRFRSQAVPGLEFEVLEPAAWRLGRKIRLWYRGARMPSAEEEGRRAEQEARRAEQEALRAEQETLRAEQETLRAEQQTRRAEQEALRAAQEMRRAEEERRRAEEEALRAEQETRRAEQEALRAEQETRRAEQEALRAEEEARRADAAEAENARLRAMLRQAGLTPE